MVLFQHDFKNILTRRKSHLSLTNVLSCKSDVFVFPKKIKAKHCVIRQMKPHGCFVVLAFDVMCFQTTVVADGY